MSIDVSFDMLISSIVLCSFFLLTENNEDLKPLLLNRDGDEPENSGSVWGGPKLNPEQNPKPKCLNWGLEPLRHHQCA